MTKVTIEFGNEDSRLTIDYCASEDGGSQEVAAPVVTIFRINQEEELNKCKEYFERAYSNETPGCRGCGYQGISIAGILEACLNCQTGELPKRKIDKSKELLCYMRNSFPLFDKFYGENEAQIEYLLSIKD